MKKIICSALIAVSLATATPTRPAQAGIIFAPFLFGIALIVVGVVHHNLLLLVLDTDGNVAPDSLEAGLRERFPLIEDQTAIRDLADALIAKSADAPALEDGKKMVSLTRAEVTSILEPTALEILNPEAFEQVVAQLK